LKNLTGKRDKILLNLLENCQKNHFRKMKFGLFSNAKLAFFKLIGSIAFYRVRGCLHWLSSAILSRVAVRLIITSKALRVIKLKRCVPSCHAQVVS